MDIEVFRQHLNEWGVNAQVLALVGVVSLILLFISVRVVLKWYLGIQSLEDEISAARRQLSAMQAQLNKMELHGEFEGADASGNFKKADGRSDAADLNNKDKSFRLTH